MTSQIASDGSNVCNKIKKCLPVHVWSTFNLRIRGTALSLGCRSYFKLRCSLLEVMDRWRLLQQGFLEEGEIFVSLFPRNCFIYRRLMAYGSCPLSVLRQCISYCTISIVNSEMNFGLISVVLWNTDRRHDYPQGSSFAQRDALRGGPYVPAES